MIQIIDYAAHSTDDAWDAGLTRLTLDLTTGKIPDMLLLSQVMPISRYASVGLFEDLNPFIDADPGLNREDYFENLLHVTKIYLSCFVQKITV